MQLLGSQEDTAARNAATSVVVGRQPIVDRDGDVVGFELLYRSAEMDAPAVTGEQMTASVVLGALTIGLDQLVGDKELFCNADRGVLLGTTPITLPPDRTVIEVLENVVIDDEAVAGCHELLSSGFTLALDDFVWVDGAERLLELVSIVKLDLLNVARDVISDLVDRCRPYGVRLVAEKVETDEDIAWAMELGFELFQGYAIERPKIVKGETIPASSVTHMQLALTLLSQDLDFDELEAILRREPGLVVQVLQMASIGSYGGLRRPVRTVREALVLLGTTRIRQWVALTILNGQKGGSLDGLAVSLIRARMCELAAQDRPDIDSEFAFTAGLLSSLELLVSVDVEQLQSQLDIDEELKAVAFRHEGEVGGLVGSVIAYQAAVSGAAPGQVAAVVDPHLDGVAASAFAWAMPYVNTLLAS